MGRTFIALALACALAGCGERTTRARDGASTATVSGRLLERLDAPPYSFLRIETAQGEVWAAVPIGALAPGAEVEVKGGVPVRNFEARTLKRRFDSVVFGTLAR